MEKTPLIFVLIISALILAGIIFTVGIIISKISVLDEQPLVGGCAGVYYPYWNECCDRWASENNIVHTQCVGNWTVEGNICKWICETG